MIKLMYDYLLKYGIIIQDKINLILIKQTQCV